MRGQKMEMLDDVFWSVAHDVQPLATCVEVDDHFPDREPLWLPYRQVRWDWVGIDNKLTRIWWEFGGQDDVSSSVHRPLWTLEFTFNYELHRIDIQCGTDVPHVEVPVIYSAAGLEGQMQLAGSSAIISPSLHQLVASLSAHVELVQMIHSSTPVFSSR